MELWTALVIGFLGSFHCVGMCGPIAMALPGTNGSMVKVVTGRMIYNIGRVITYSVLGLLFGLAGYTIAFVGWQQILSVALGILFIGAAVFRMPALSGIKKKLGVDYAFKKIQNAISRLFQKAGSGTLLGIGLLNGFLPCGFVYVGLAGAVTTGSVIEGGQFMALFGIGTFPAMMAMSLAPTLISVSLRRRINKALPILTGAFGIYLIVRGLVMAEMIT